MIALDESFHGIFVVILSHIGALWTVQTPQRLGAPCDFFPRGWLCGTSTQVASKKLLLSLFVVCVGQYVWRTMQSGSERVILSTLGLLLARLRIFSLGIDVKCPRFGSAFDIPGSLLIRVSTLP